MIQGEDSSKVFADGIWVNAILALSLVDPCQHDDGLSERVFGHVSMLFPEALRPVNFGQVFQMG